MSSVMIDAGHYGTVNKSHICPAYIEAKRMWDLHLLLKKELEKRGITVGTTRAEQGIDLSTFARGSKAKGYDLFISLHSNTCDNPEVDRAVSIIYQDLKTDLTDNSQKIGQILGEAVKKTMGLSSLQLYRKKSPTDRDGDGALNDEYYGVLNAARQVGVPGMIMEHGFHTNEDTCKWLLNDENLQKLAEAEATAILEFFAITQKTELKVGDLVKIKENAVYVNGKTVPASVREHSYFIKSIRNNRIVIDASEDGTKHIYSAIDVSYLEKINDTIKTVKPLLARVMTQSNGKGKSTHLLTKGTKVRCGVSNGAYTYLPDYQGYIKSTYLK